MKSLIEIQFNVWQKNKKYFFIDSKYQNLSLMNVLACIYIEFHFLYYLCLKQKRF